MAPHTAIEIAVGSVKAYVRADGEIHIGQNVRVVEGTELGWPNKPIENLYIGDNVTLFGGKFATKSLVIGDYTKIHNGAWCYGRGHCYIGYNAWFGRTCTIDCEGGFSVGNGFGAGEESKLWSHIRHGDVLEGCAYLSFGRFVAGDDVWLVGRCSTSPVRIADKVVVFNESNVVHDIDVPNTVWAGNPARDITAKVGKPYSTRSLEDKWRIFNNKVSSFHGSPNDMEEFRSNLDLDKRTYRKTGSATEVELMWHLLPEIKLTPQGCGLPHYA